VYVCVCVLKEGGWLCVGCVSLRHLDGWFICDRYGEL
jgi:hypothetical protein